MKKYLYGILIFLISNTGNAQTGADKSDNKIILGTIDNIESKILKEKRQVWVYVPNGEQGGRVTAPTKYPVVYLLDGDGHFYSVVGMIQQLSSINGNTICPEMIVVGITNTDRTRDLTPTAVAAGPYMDSNFVRTSGGGEQFTRFMKEELMPYIDSTYPTLPYKVMIGHSLGGLAVINTLLKHKDLFNAYVAIDPSMWWDNQKLNKSAGTILSQKDYKGKSLFLGIANTMNPGMDTGKVKLDTSMDSEHIRSIFALNNIFQQSKSNGLAYSYKYYDDETHGSVPLISTYDALKHIFKFFDLRLTMEDNMNFSRSTITKVENHYKEVSKHFGFNYPVPELMINQMGYMAMGSQKMEEAEYLFKMNIKNYPTSLNVYDSMGDFYSAKGEKDKAIENYKKALAIREFPVTRTKLDALMKQVPAK